MKKNWIASMLLILSLPIFIAGCVRPGEEPTAQPEEKPKTLRVVALGDSMTNGIQDAGLLRDFQLNSYPYLIAKQMGIEISFQQPYVESPGIGVLPYKVPLKLQDGQIVQTLWPKTPTPTEMFDWIFPKLSNVSYPLPYNNLGVNGARLFDMRKTTTGTTDGNYFFDIVLRNSTPSPLPNFNGKTAVQEALMLQPDIILLWIGNNDILGAALVGCGINGKIDGQDFPYTTTKTPITPYGDFTDEYRRLLSDLKSGSSAHIVMATIPKYLPFALALDDIYKPTLVGNRLCLFNPQTFAPIDFDPDPDAELYIPLFLEETTATHLLLTGAIAYLEGKGIYDAAALDTMGYNSTQAALVISTLEAAGITPSFAMLTGDFTITPDEETTVIDVITKYNVILTSLSTEFDVPLVDIVGSWWGDASTTNPAFGGYSGAHPIQDQDTTTFSLDGVHPNNLGHALSANAFIKVLNQEWSLGIPELNPESFKGQYTGKSILPGSIKAIERVKEMYQSK